MVVDPLRGLSVTWHLLPDISSPTAAMGRPPGRLMPVTAPNDHPPAGGASAHLPVDPTGDDPGLERRLGAADPLAGVLPDDASTALVRRLAADVAAGALVPWSRRRQRRRATLTLLAAAILLCLAAGTQVSPTGWPPGPGSTALGSARSRERVPAHHRPRLPAGARVAAPHTPAAAARL